MSENLCTGDDWPIPLPSDDGLRSRVLVARDEDGREKWRWAWADRAKTWRREGLFVHYEDWAAVVQAALDFGWTLWSVPTDGVANDG